MLPHDSMQVMPFWQENHRSNAVPLAVPGGMGGQWSRYHSLTSVTRLWWCLHVKVLFFLLSLISLLRGLGIFFKSPPSDSGVCPGLGGRMAEVHQDGWRS